MIDLTQLVTADMKAAAERKSTFRDLTMRQFRLGLLGAGLLQDVDAAIAAMPEPAKSAASIEFEYATVVVRDNALVDGLTASLGLTEEQIDALWLAALEL